MSKYHIPVLLQEVMEGLQIQEGAIYIDATLGGGGHTVEIIKKGGRVLGIDVDEDALNYVKSRIKNQEVEIKGEGVNLAKGNFKNIDRLAKENEFEKIAGVLFDLGVSSFQLDICRAPAIFSSPDFRRLP